MLSTKHSGKNPVRTMRGRSITDLIVQVLGICLLVLLWVFTVLSITNSGGRIPSHFKLDGTVDGYADSRFLWILPVMGTVMYFVMMVLIRILPRLLPFSNSLSGSNTEKRQAVIRTILKGFQILFVSQVNCVSLSLFLIVTNRIQKVPGFVFPSFLAGGLVLIVFLVIQGLKDKES
jgi:hypothetical protein